MEFGLLENLKTKVENEMNNLPTEDELVYKLKKCILSQKPERISIDKASEKLHISERALQRKLRKLDIPFKNVEYSLQLRLAKTYLKENQKSNEEISYLLRFSESSVFIRFFKSLTNEKYINNLFSMK
ncbi:AraC family transcriptional regulator [uncultured Psychroserpens sp.]|uniref:helix-turn-helix domain-containing protein n=1 Tax=uncultured Psychroserpens sp. TaxID=255436 RepID=UPI002638ABE6|nr:helix-turn-helix domain-containing protein [uncultured Psychroserpens sp.]